MAHIELPEGIPGINGPMMKYPETAQHLRGLAEALASFVRQNFIALA